MKKLWLVLALIVILSVCVGQAEINNTAYKNVSDLNGFKALEADKQKYAVTGTFGPSSTNSIKLIIGSRIATVTGQLYVKGKTPNGYIQTMEVDFVAKDNRTFVNGDNYTIRGTYSWITGLEKNGIYTVKFPVLIED